MLNVFPVSFTLGCTSVTSTVMTASTDSSLVVSLALIVTMYELFAPSSSLFSWFGPFELLKPEAPVFHVRAPVVLLIEKYSQSAAPDVLSE